MEPGISERLAARMASMASTQQGCRSAQKNLADEVASAEARVIACGRRIENALGSFGGGSETSKGGLSVDPFTGPPKDSSFTTDAPLHFFLIWFGPASNFSPRYGFAIQSILAHHPFARVSLYSNSLPREFLSEYGTATAKVSVVRFSLEELAAETPIQEWLDQNREIYTSGPHSAVHQADLVRLLLLYSHGGIYIDTDVIVTAPMHEVRNSIGVEGELVMPLQSPEDGRIIEGAGGISLVVCNAVLSFEAGHPYIAACLAEWATSYNPHHRSWNGPLLCTRVLARGESHGALVLPPQAFYPVHYSEVGAWFEPPCDPAFESPVVKHTEEGDRDSSRGMCQDPNTSDPLRLPPVDIDIEDPRVSDIGSGSFAFHYWNSFTKDKEMRVRHIGHREEEAEGDIEGDDISGVGQQRDDVFPLVELPPPGQQAWLSAAPPSMSEILIEHPEGITIPGMAPLNETLIEQLIRRHCR